MILDGTCIPHGTLETETLSKRAIKELPDENEWMLRAKVGQILRAINPVFDARAHGSKSLHLLIGSEPGKFDLKSNEYGRVPSGYLVRLKLAAHSW